MISLKKAKQALEASEKMAQDIGVLVTTVIVDDHGVLIAASRMDGALNISPKFALEKAYTSANLGSSTEELAPYAGEGKPYFGFNTLFGGELTAIAGGAPVKMNGKVVGGVGVGGSMDVKKDAECAKEAVKMLEK